MESLSIRKRTNQQCGKLSSSQGGTSTSSLWHGNASSPPSHKIWLNKFTFFPFVELLWNLVARKYHRVFPVWHFCSAKVLLAITINFMYRWSEVFQTQWLFCFWHKIEIALYSWEDEVLWIGAAVIVVLCRFPIIPIQVSSSDRIWDFSRQRGCADNLDEYFRPEFSWQEWNCYVPNSVGKNVLWKEANWSHEVLSITMRSFI